MRNKIVGTAVTVACLASMSTHAADATTEKTTIGGRGFIDFTHIDQKLNGNNTDATGYGVDVKRFYLIVDHTFDDIWAADITTDFNYAGKTTETQETQVYIKKAYVQAKLDDAFTLRVGSADTPWVPYVEGLYGYRYYEQVMIDRTGYGTSADWGVHAFGKFANGMVNYAVSALNGRGYKDPSRSKTMDFESRLSLVPVTGLNIAVGYRSGKLGQELESTTGTRTASRWDALVAYVGGPARVGVEYFQAKNYSAALVLGTSPKDKADGYSAWGSFNVAPATAVFARYEQLKPNKDTNSNNKNTYYTAGVTYQARKNVDLSLGYKNTKVQSGVNTTKTNEIGVWSQVSF